MAAIYYIIGTLSLLLSGGHATESDSIQIFFGTHDEKEIQNGSTLIVDLTNGTTLQRLKFSAARAAIIAVASDLTNMTTSFHEAFRTVDAETLNHTHYFEITDSGSIVVHGLMESTGNSDYMIVIYFTINVRRENPSTTTKTTTDSVLTSSTAATQDTPTLATTHRGGKATIDGEVGPSTGNVVQVETSTLIIVVVVMVLVVLALCLASVAAVILCLHYRKRFKEKDLEGQSSEQDYDLANT